MGFFRKLFKKTDEPQKAKVAAVNIQSGGLIRGKTPPPRRRARSIWEEGTGILDEPPQEAEPRPRKGSVVPHILYSYMNTAAVYAIKATSEEVDALVAAGEWKLVCYCATNASDEAVQIHAVDKLIESRRFYDVLSVIDRSMDREHAKRRGYALPILEQHVDDIVANNFVQETEGGVNRHLLEFMIQHTENLAVAKRLIDGAIERGTPGDLVTANKTNRTVNILVLDALENTGEWKLLKRQAEYYFAYMYVDEFRYAMEIFDRNVDKILDATTLTMVLADDNEMRMAATKDDTSILRFIGEYTSDVSVARKVIEVIDGEGLAGIAKSAVDKQQVGMKMFGVVLERENAEEIGKLAVDRLAGLGDNDKLATLVAEAELPEIRGYAQIKLIGLS